jgi:hypothetical protein
MRPIKVGRVSLKISHICLWLFIILTSASGSAVSEEGMKGVEEVEAADIAPAPEDLNLEGIWTFSLGGAGEMTAALHQSGDSIWGGARSGGAGAQKGVLTGSIYGDQIEIITLSAAGDVLAVTRMRGTVAGETASGSYFRIDSLGVATRGSFAGMRTGTDVAGYPALSSQADAANAQGSNISEAVVKPEAVEEAGGYTDVHQLSAGINPRILGYAAPVTGKSRIV